jgi:hypothetical protein
MNAINYVTNSAGHRKAVLIDLDELKRNGQTGHDVWLYLQEDLEDLLDIELSKDEPTVSWAVVKEQLKNDNLLD